MIKVLRRINGNFEPYAVAINFKDEDLTIMVDGSKQLWISKKRALKLSTDIQRKLK